MTRVWKTILAIELPFNDPLATAPVYWQQFVLHQGTAPSIANLYTENCTKLWIGLEESAVMHSEIGWVGTLELWVDLLSHLFATLNTRHALPGPWENTMPDLCAMQLWTA